MTLLGSPRPPRSCLDRGTRSPTTTSEMEMLRRRVWLQQGVVSLLPSVGADDTFTLGADTLTVQHAERDAAGTAWRVFCQR